MEKLGVAHDERTALGQMNSRGGAASREVLQSLGLLDLGKAHR